MSDLPIIPATLPVRIKVMAYQKAHIIKKISELENDLTNPVLAADKQIITKEQLNVAIQELKNWAEDLFVQSEPISPVDWVDNTPEEE